MSQQIKEALSPDEFQAWDETGKVPAKKKEAPYEAPKKLGIKTLKFKDIKLQDVKLALNGRREIKRNKDGFLFIGFRVSLEMQDKTIVEGWMDEGNYLELIRELSRDALVNIDAMEH